MGSRARGLAAAAAKPISAAVDVVRPRPDGTVVLIYHRVGAGKPIQMDLPTSLFERQIERIAAGGTAVDLDTALERLRAPEPLDGTPEGTPPVVVTFDDGTTDFVEHALPVLAAHSVPATIYLATDHVERGVDFVHGGRPLSWDSLRDALSTGLVTIGSHTHTHALLDRLPPDAAEDELRRSCELIEDRLGVVAEHFAYPKALLGSRPVEALVRARFRSAALAGTRPNVAGRTDPYRLSRSPIQTADGFRWFERKLRGGMSFEDDMRRIVNRRRYAGATT